MAFWIRSELVDKINNKTELPNYYFQVKEVESLNFSFMVKNVSAEEMPTSLMAFYVVILIIGLLGNVSTCIVIVKNPAMQSATNYYLFSLAVSDIFLLIIGMVIDYFNIWVKSSSWPLSPISCRLHYPFHVCYNASILTVTAFSVERYLVICHPLSFNKTNRLKKAVAVILGSWIISFILAIPQFFIRETEKNDLVLADSWVLIRSDLLVFCLIKKDKINGVFFFMDLVLLFFIPTIIIIFVYVRIGIKMYNSTRNTLASVSDRNLNVTRHLALRKSKCKMLAIVVIITFISWSPRRIKEIINLMKSNYSWDYEFNIDFGWHYPNSLFYCSAAANPIIYNLMSTRYRECFKQTLLCKNNSDKKEKNNKIYFTEESHL